MTFFSSSESRFGTTCNWSNCQVLYALVHILWLSSGALQADHPDEDIHSACLVPGLPVNLDLSRLLQVRSLYRQEVWSEDCQ